MFISRDLLSFMSFQPQEGSPLQSFNHLRTQSPSLSTIFSNLPHANFLEFKNLYTNAVELPDTTPFYQLLIICYSINILKILKPIFIYEL